MKKIVLCALVVFYIVFLHGCANSHVNLSSRDIKTTPLPVVVTYRNDIDLCYLLTITAIDGKPLADVSSANVDAGTHEVEYACYGKDGKIKQSERIKIKAEPGMSYVLMEKSIVDTKNYKSKELTSKHEYLERDEVGRLVKRSEPVYTEVNRTATTVKGITVDVHVCPGYPYMTERKVQGLFMQYPVREMKCLKEQSLLLKFLNHDGVVYHPLF